MPRYVALMRGINVGKAKRVAMADLREIASGLGFTEISTILNSGNLIFSAAVSKEAGLAKKIKEGIAARCSVDCAVTVVSGGTLNRIVRENPLKEACANPPYFLIGFVQSPKAMLRAKTLMEEPWHPDAIAIGADAIYLWCDSGVLDSPLNKSFARLMGEQVTARNWATLEKICAVL